MPDKPSERPADSQRDRPEVGWTGIVGIGTDQSGVEAGWSVAANLGRDFSRTEKHDNQGLTEPVHSQPVHVTQFKRESKREIVFRSRLTALERLPPRLDLISSLL